MKSKITGGLTEKILSIKVMGRYEVDYFRCKETGFIQTEEPYWLEEAYSFAITKLDVGLPERNETLRNKIIPILSNHFNVEGTFLDFAGGYGLFTRMMRDKGFNFYHTDKHCPNLFAEFFDLVDIKNENFELVTAFEVFEHLPNPIPEIEAILKYSDNLLFTTVLPPNEVKELKQWWYLIPETGQHISFYSAKSLQSIADQFGRNFYTDGISTHLFTKKKLTLNPFTVQKTPFLIRIMKRKVDRYFRKAYGRESLLQKDWQEIKDKLM